MNIGVIGGGNVGTALAKRLVPEGHEVMLSFGRDPANLGQAATMFGARMGSPRDAVEFGDVVARAVPWEVVAPALHEAGSVAGKIVWDCTNALRPDMSGLAIGTTTSGAETVQRLAPGARVVKGIPPSPSSSTAPNRPSTASPWESSSAATTRQPNASWRNSCRRCPRRSPTSGRSRTRATSSPR
jgi:8-hydroxy-5-deazaflavin:NADPH oxidoreductase